MLGLAVLVCVPTHSALAQPVGLADASAGVVPQASPPIDLDSPGVVPSPPMEAQPETMEARNAFAPDSDTVVDPHPPLTQRTDGFRSEVERVWFSSGTDPSTRALATRTQSLQLGATNYEGAARALLAGEKPVGTGLERAVLAVRLAPDLPFARMKLAAAYLDEGEFGSAAQEAIEAVRAIPKNLEATLWLAGSLLAMFAAVLIGGSLVFIVWVGTSAFPHAVHDVGDLVSNEMPDFARAALLASLLLVPVLLGEAFMGLVLGLFLLGLVYSPPGCRRALTLAAILLLVGLYPMTRLAGVALTALDSDPVAGAADAVVRSMTSPADLDVLLRAEKSDSLAAYALALHERRSGDPAVARVRYEGLRKEAPIDPILLANLSNMHFERGENELAIRLAERAATQVRSATLLFNLSQVYARSFQMDEFEGAMAQAQAVDPEVVAGLSRSAAPDFVADLEFPQAPIRERLIENASGERFLQPVSRALMPGRLGESWKHTAGGFFAVAVLGFLLRGRWEHSSTCGRCGRRICNRCDGSVWNNQICDGCHHLFHRPETTDPAMRMARLSELRSREALLSKLAVAASTLVPGVGGLLAKRADLSFLGLLFFAWAGVLFFGRDGIVVDPLAVGAAGPLLFLIAGGLAALGYVTTVGIGLLIRRSL